MKRKCIILSAVLFFYTAGWAQPANLYVKDALKANRTKLYQNLVKNTITKNLSLPLADSTEENWMDAFYALQLTKYKSSWIDSRIRTAFDSADKRSDDFQFALLELAYDHYPKIFAAKAEHLFNISEDQKVMALAGEYLIVAKPELKQVVGNKAWEIVYHRDSTKLLLLHLSYNAEKYAAIHTPPMKAFLHQSFFQNAKVVYSFQRHNRNYPGLAVIRDSSGNFVRDSITGEIFSVPQLARSISNLPFYFTGGNTPQGIFRMDGFAVSRSNFIGPTGNIQLSMPYETSIQHFMNDSTITDSVWTRDMYEKLLPERWKGYMPVYETFFGGRVGRTEIIAHGTTVDPSYYKGQIYYPLTPTFGCLATKEIWSEETGKRTFSDQQRLVDYLRKAGGANGYYIVIELDDKQTAVTLDEIKALLKP